MGANALLIDYDAKFYIGLDALVFTAGLYAKLTATVGITKDSSIGFGGLSGLAAGDGCRRVDVTINGSYGIGYTIPALVVTEGRHTQTPSRGKPGQRPPDRADLPVCK